MYFHKTASFRKKNNDFSHLKNDRGMRDFHSLYPVILLISSPLEVVIMIRFFIQYLRKLLMSKTIFYFVRLMLVRLRMPFFLCILINRKVSMG